jgi:ElaB/YqjD/DUF883 family membrane-anchored ribosome-binding protein
MSEESEREIRERIEATRARMGDTIEEIGDRVNPDRVQRELKARAREQVDDFKHTVKQKARDKMRDVEHGVTDRGRGLWDTIKENPIPAGMVGVGLAWLVANGRNRDDERSSRGSRHLAAGDHRDYPGRGDYPGYGAYPESANRDYGRGYMTATGEETHARGTGMGMGMEASVPVGRPYPGGERSSHDTEGVREGARDAAARVREGAEHAVDRVREEAQHAADTVREKGSEIAHRASEGIDDARHRVEDWADQAQERARRAEHRVEDAVRDHPMAAGMIAAALGFAAGMMIPETQKEHEMMGPTRDRMLDRAQETARRAGQQAKEVARDTASASAEAAMDEMWPGGSGPERSSVTEPGR